MVEVGSTAQNPAEHQGCRVERHADVDHDGREDRDDRQPVAAVAVVAPFEKIRQRGNPRTQVQRREEQRQQDEREAGHPFEVAEDHAVLVGRLGEAHQVHRRDVGGEHRQPDHRPAERVAGQEVVVPFAAPRTECPGIAAQRHDGRQIREHDRQVSPREQRVIQGPTLGWSTGRFTCIPMPRPLRWRSGPTPRVAAAGGARWRCPS